MPGLNEPETLNEAVARWRRELRAHGLRRAADLDEIENHLLEHCDDLRRRGFSPSEAFAAALDRLGPAAELAREYRKIAREELLMKVLLWIFQFIANLLLWVGFEIIQAYRAGTAAGSSAPHPDPEEPTHV